MTDNLKKIILILAILVLIMGVILIVLLTKQRSELEGQDEVLEEVEIPSEIDESEISKKISIVNSENEFFTMQNILENYLLYIKAENVDAVYNMLDENYIKQNNIDNTNVITQMKSKINSYDDSFELKQAYYRDSTNTAIYYLYGTIAKNNNIQDFYTKIYLDRSNNAYSIFLINKEQYEQYISENLKEDTTKEILQNQYNKFKMTTLSQEEIANKYFNDYIYLAASNSQKAYELLQEDYKKSKFQTIDKYKKYLEERKDVIDSLNTKGIKTVDDFNSIEEYTSYINNLILKGIRQYKFENTNNGKQCICIDSYDNYYIFNITSPMQYTVILDTYTIDLPEFTEQYNNSTNEKKVQLNISKFFAAINNSDYEYAYSKLDETYKQNNFATLESFENYIKQNFFEQNKVSVGNAQKQNDIYLYDATIEDASGKNNNKITKTFVMQLKEGTDFVMSFSAN